MSSPGGATVGRVSIKVVPDTSKFRQELLAQLKKIEKSLKLEIPVEFDAKRASAQLAVLKKRLDSISRTIRIRTDIGGLSSTLDKVGKSAQGAGDGFSHMSRLALIAGAVILLIAPALGLIATLLAALPSLLLALGAGFAAVALGMDGIKNAAKVMGPAVESLKASLSATFEKGLTPVFEKLVTIFPVLERGLNAVALGVIDIISALTDVVTSAKGMEQIETFLGNTGKFFTDLAPAIASFTRTFLTLATEGSKMFETLSSTINGFAGTFEQMIDRAVGNGTFERAILGLAQVTVTLLDVFTDLFEAGLQAMGMLGGPLSNLLGTFGDLLVALMPALTLISSLFANVLAEAFRQLVPIVEALMPAFESLVAILGPLLIGALKILGPLLTTIADILSRVLLKAFEALAPMVPPLLDFMTQLADVLGQALLTALVTLTPYLDQLIQFFTDMIAALMPLLPSIMELVQVGLQGFLDIMVALMPHLMRFMSEIMPAMIQAVKDLTPAFISIIEKVTELIPKLVELFIQVADFLIPIFLEVANVVEHVFSLIKNVISGALTAIEGYIDIFIGLITGDWEQMWQGIKKVTEGGLQILKGVFVDGLKLIKDLFIDFPLQMVAAMGDTGSRLAESGRALIRGFIQGMKDMIPDAKSVASGLVAAVKSFFPFSPAKEGPLSGRGYTTYSGKALIEDFAKGMLSGAPAAVSAIDDIMGQTQGALEIQALVQSDGFGSIGDKVSAALSGWTVEMDANGLTRMVNRVNRKNERR